MREKFFWRSIPSFNSMSIIYHVLTFTKQYSATSLARVMLMEIIRCGFTFRDSPALGLLVYLNLPSCRHRSYIVLPYEKKKLLISSVHGLPVMTTDLKPVVHIGKLLYKLHGDTTPGKPAQRRLDETDSNKKYCSDSNPPSQQPTRLLLSRPCARCATTRASSMASSSSRRAPPSRIRSRRAKASSTPW